VAFKARAKGRLSGGWRGGGTRGEGSAIHASFKKSTPCFEALQREVNCHNHQYEIGRWGRGGSGGGGVLLRRGIEEVLDIM